MLYEKYIRPCLFRTDPEWIHGAGISAMKSEVISKTLGNMVGPQGHPVKLWGLTFRNPLGLAAGFDKNAEVIPAAYHLGFGFTEVGTVTAHAQPGNPRPRIFRIPEQQALVNRLGFPNQGAQVIAKRISAVRSSRTFDRFPIGINLGKSKVTELDQAAEDYLYSFQLLEPFGDFFVINVSSPNTPSLRELQSPERLGPMLSPLLEENAGRNQKPVLLKIAPDLETEDIDAILEAIETHRLDGIVATNTTVDHSSIDLNETGGLSGSPLTRRSTEVIRHIHRVTNGKLPIIGVGGVVTREDYEEKLQAGASLVQVYTGFVYQGPLVVRKLLMAE